ncbi:MAG: serine--tRNA ligase [Dehalococcoidia bacterium]|nr:serine--tRNA ligase [Dehalococcoidia bacterium]
MLSIELIRKDPEYVRQALLKRGEDVPIHRLSELDLRRRQEIQNGDGLRAHRNEASKRIAQMDERPTDLVNELRRLGDEIKLFEQEVAELQTNIHGLLLELPNVPLDDVRPGLGEEDNLVLRTWGEPRSFDFTPRPHWELGEQLGIIDFQRGAKLSGSRFFILSGMGAKLERAIINWMLDLHTTEHGYKEIYPPVLVKREVMEGSGNLPKFSSNLYHDEEDDLWLIPTAEVPLTNIHRDEILPPGTLPLYYTAYTPCFRREKAAAGRDTRGIKRVHQFDKVEMYKFVEPETSGAELAKMLADVEDVCRQLELPYRVLELCAGDMGFASAKSYDLEMWAPGCEEWLEVSSCSNCTDFQARRANVRYRPESRARPEYAHTLNASGLALPRVVISILENCQQEDGSIVIPEVLRPYTGYDVIPAANNSK